MLTYSLKGGEISLGSFTDYPPWAKNQELLVEQASYSEHPQTGKAGNWGQMCPRTYSVCPREEGQKTSSVLL